jgi:hypothetical protein
VTYFSFLLFGPGLWQMNLVPVFFSVLLFFALALLASKFFPEARLLFFLLLTLNYPLWAYGRINDQVMPMTLFVVLGIFFFLKGWKRPIHFFPAAVCFAFSFLSKPKIIYFHLVVLPLAFFLILASRGEFRKFRLNFVRLGYFFGGALLIAIPWYIFIYSAHPEVFKNVGGLNAKAMLPQNIGAAVSFWLKKPAYSFFPTNRVLAIILFLYLLLLVVLLFKKGAKAHIAPLEILSLVWLIVGLAIHSLIGYRPIRHYIEFTIPFAILASIFLARLASGLRISLDLKRKGLFFTYAAALIWAAVFSYSQKIYSPERLDLHPEIRAQAILLTLAVSLALALVLLILTRMLAGKTLILPRKAGLAAVALFTLFYGYQNVFVYVLWTGNRTYDLKTVGRDLGRAFPRAVFSGLLIPTLSLENRNPAHTFWPDYANDDPYFLDRDGVTHLFLGLYNSEPEQYEKYFPEAMARGKILVRYRMWRSWFLLYDIRPAPPSPGAETVHEAEGMERLFGRPEFDPGAGGRFAVRVEAGQRGIVGREKLVFANDMRAELGLFLKLENAGSPGLRLRLRITRRGRLVSENTFQLTGSFSAATYVPLTLEVDFEKNIPYILDVATSGQGSFLFDRLEIHPLRRP